jgi:hypothetical protein
MLSAKQLADYVKVVMPGRGYRQPREFGPGEIEMAYKCLNELQQRLQEHEHENTPDYEGGVD